MNLKDKTVLVTGGTGSFGKFFVKKLLKNYPTINKVVVFSRDELKQHEMSIEIDHKFKEKIRFFLGDIRDLQRLKRAFEGVDIVVHAAALKQVPAAEYNPFEFIKTNVVGTQNIVDACLDLGIQKMVALSTDKASSPVIIATSLTNSSLSSDISVSIFVVLLKALVKLVNAVLVLES